MWPAWSQILFYIVKYCFKILVRGINVLCITSNIRDLYTMQGQEGQDGNGNGRVKLSCAMLPIFEQDGNVAL